MDVENRSKPDLIWLERISKLLDSKFTIPGTNIQFGIDPIIGMIPIAGDVVTYGVSLTLIGYMIKNGASGKLVFKMLFNTVLDLLVGGIPIVGTVADFFIRANDRNIAMYKEYVEQGKHNGSAKGMLFALLFAAFLLVGGIVALVSWGIASLINLF